MDSCVCTLQGFISAQVGGIFMTIHKGSLNGITVYLALERLSGLKIGGVLFHESTVPTLGSCTLGQRDLLSLCVGESSLGSISDSLGNVIVCPVGCVALNAKWVQESLAPGIIDRQSVCEAIELGALGVDTMIPIGLGQRELIVGDRQTGKTSLALDGVINQRFSNVLCCYVVCALESSTILGIYLLFLDNGAMFYSELCCESSVSLAVQQYLAMYTSAALAEYFTLVHEFPMFLVHDDLSKHAVAYREVSLLLRRPPGREAYPGEISFVHSRLLERSAKLHVDIGTGSVTAFPMIETLSGDCTAYVPTNVISITDGQIFL